MLWRQQQATTGRSKRLKRWSGYRNWLDYTNWTKQQKSVPDESGTKQNEHRLTVETDRDTSNSHSSHEGNNGPTDSWETHSMSLYRWPGLLFQKVDLRVGQSILYTDILSHLCWVFLLFNQYIKTPNRSPNQTNKQPCSTRDRGQWCGHPPIVQREQLTPRCHDHRSLEWESRYRKSTDSSLLSTTTLKRSSVKEQFLRSTWVRVRSLRRLMCFTYCRWLMNQKFASVKGECEI
jgi:hypothetical protein